MKTIKIAFLAIACICIAASVSAQKKTESFNVSGNCGMCKTKIEKAAKDAGASSAEWDVEKKEITVTYNSSTTNAAKIQQKIASVGYDNAGAKASDESYDKLHGCCKYERAAATTDKEDACCSEGEKCEKDCCKDKDGKGNKHHKGEKGEKGDKTSHKENCTKEDDSCCKKS